MRWLVLAAVAVTAMRFERYNNCTDVQVYSANAMLSLYFTHNCERLPASLVCDRRANADAILVHWHSLVVTYQHAQIQRIAKLFNRHYTLTNNSYGVLSTYKALAHPGVTWLHASRRHWLQRAHNTQLDYTLPTWQLRVNTPAWFVERERHAHLRLLNHSHTIATSACSRATSDDWLCFERVGETQGSVNIIANVRVDTSKLAQYRCGCVRSDEFDVHNVAFDTNECIGVPTYDRVVYARVPDQQYFQHFIDGFLPKLTVSWLFFQHSSETKLFWQFKRTPFIDDVFAQFGIGAEQLLSDTRFCAKQLILVCRTPCFHPLIYQSTRHLLGEPVRRGERYIVLFDRPVASTLHPGRAWSNVDAVRARLVTMCVAERCTVVTFDHRQFPRLAMLREFFQNVVFAIGPHGGALYNCLFMSKDSTLVELYTESLYRAALSQRIIFLMSSAANVQYYRLHVDANSSGLAVDPDTVLRLATEALQRRLYNSRASVSMDECVA